jgi:hypothetical protein
MRNTNKQAMKAKYSNLIRTSILGTLGTFSLVLSVNDSDTILPNIIGVALLAFTGFLHRNWYGNDLTEYRNEFLTNKNE